MADYRTIIGLEVHVELATKTKTFCSCANDGIGAMPNTLTCPVCLGLPGSVPTVNKRAIELTIMAGLLLNSKIATKIMFERKNFFLSVESKGYFEEVLNSDDKRFGGEGRINEGKLLSFSHEYKGYSYALSITLPPLSAVIIKKTEEL